MEVHLLSWRNRGDICTGIYVSQNSGEIVEIAVICTHRPIFTFT